MNNKLVPQLVLCNTRKTVSVEFRGGVSPHQLEKIELLLGLFLLSCTIIVALLLLYRKYKASRTVIEQEIVGLRDRGYEVK